MPVPVHALELPVVDLELSLDREERLADIDHLQSAHWLARSPFGYVVTRHDDCVAVLKDNRWHQALSTDELIMLANAVLLAGTDTTRNQLGCALAVFAEHPDQWALLREHPELAGRATEESLRYLGAVRRTGRFASVDIEYRDVLFPAGTLIFPSFVGANHDPEHFDNPHTFDITAERSATHLTLGFGLHYCLGANLARAELQEALFILANRMPDVRLDGDVAWKPDSVGIWGPTRLPIAFTNHGSTEVTDTASPATVQN